MLFEYLIAYFGNLISKLFTLQDALYLFSNLMQGFFEMNTFYLHKALQTETRLPGSVSFPTENP